MAELGHPLEAYVCSPFAARAALVVSRNDRKIKWATSHTNDAYDFDETCERNGFFIGSTASRACLLPSSAASVT